MMNLFKDKLNEVNNILLISHISPDGDNIGSLVSMATALKNKGYNTSILKVDDIEFKYDYLLNFHSVEERKSILKKEFDMAIILDCGSIDRIGNNQDILENIKTIVNIDHHITNTNFGDINIVEPKSSSTCEIVYKVLTYLDIKIDEKIATSIYTGIVTDTGSFAYNNTNEQTLSIASDLLKLGANREIIYKNIYQNKSINEIHFLGNMLKDIKLEFDGKVGMLDVKDEILKKYNLNYNQVDELINKLREIKGVEIAILLKEISEEEVKVSFRAKGKVDVSELAIKFGGGGHRQAAGAMIRTNIREANSLIKEALYNLF